MLFKIQINNHLFSARKYYLKLLLSFLFMATLIVLSTSIVFTQLYTKDIYDQLLVDYVNNITSVQYEFDNVFSQLKNTYVFMIQLPDINNFLTSPNNDLTSINRASGYLTSLNSINPYLYSTIVFNKDTDFVLTAGKLDYADIKQFTHNKIKRLDIKSDLNIVHSTLNQSATRSTKPFDTISVIFTPSDSENVFNNAVIMNIDRNEIEKRLLANVEGGIIVADNSGTVVFESYSGLNKDSIADEIYFQNILSSDFLKGSFKFTRNGSPTIVSYTKSIMTDLYIINIRSINKYYDIIFKKISSIIIICLLVLIFFVLLSYVLSKSAYKPIKKVMESFLRSDLGCPNENMSELDMISKVYENTLKQLHELKVQSLSNKSTLKEFFLRSLITSEFISDSDRSKIKEYVFNIEFENLILISISIDNINDMPADKMYSHKIALCKTIPQLIKNDFRCEVVNMPDGEIALLLNFRNKDKNSFDLLLDSLGKIREISKQLSNTTVTIGIGGIANSIDECAQAYKKAVEMVKYRFVLGLDKTIYKKYLDENICTNLCYPNELEDKLISSIRLNKREDFIDVLESMIDIIQYHSYPETVSAFFNITTACIKTINQVLAQSTNKYYLNFDEFRNIFSKLLTIDQAKKWLLNLFDEYQQIVAQISNLKNTKHYSLVNKIQDYIKQNFHNPNLSVESIADLTGYTSYYFSKIFKDILGININEYIKQLRINKAKELLETTDYKTNNISDMCGFTNVSNFYLVFKKEVGLTPSLYREYVRQGGDVKP